MKKMVIIYDFDGTLTPNSLPQYEILKKCGYDDKRLMERMYLLHQIKYVQRQISLENVILD